MIHVRCLGHIKTSLGAEFVELAEPQLGADEIVDRLRSLSKEENPGFNRYNTLALVEDGEAFVPSSRGRMVRDGERVVLIPFSHGG